MFLAAPSPPVPDQLQHPCPVRDVTRPGTDPTLECDGENPTAGARRRGLVGRDHVHHPAAECVRRDAVDRKAAQVEQTRGVRYQILLNMGNSRTLKQARGLTLIMNTVLTTAMITRSRASYVSALDPSCPVKSEEPVCPTPSRGARYVSRLATRLGFTAPLCRTNALDGCSKMISPPPHWVRAARPASLRAEPRCGASTPSGVARTRLVAVVL